MIWKARRALEADVDELAREERAQRVAITGGGEAHREPIERHGLGVETVESLVAKTFVEWQESPMPAVE